MARRFVSIKPIDVAGEKPDRPGDEVLWDNLENVWFDRGVMRKRPGFATPTTYTAIAATGTASPLHGMVQFYHPVAVETEDTIYPDGAGNNTEWTAVDPTTLLENWECVKEVVSVETDYVYADTSLEKDSYTFSAVGLVTITKLIFNIRAKRHVAGDYTITFFCRTAGGVEKDIVGTDADGNATLTIPQATGEVGVWEDYTFEADTDPHTDADWTKALVDAYEFGYYATFATAAATETLYPTVNGNDAQWDRETGSGLYSSTWGMLAGNSDLGTENTWDEYIYTSEDSESVSVKFAGAENAFSTITSVTPRVWAVNVLGSRELILYVDNNTDTDAAWATWPVDAEPAPPPELPDYDDLTTDAKPAEITWSGSAEYTLDPTTSLAWTASDLATHDFNLKTTTARWGVECTKTLFPSAFATITGDWAFYHSNHQDPDATKTGQLTTSDLAGSRLQVRGPYNATGAEPYVTVTGWVSGTWSGTISGDNISITASGETGSLFIIYTKIPGTFDEATQLITYAGSAPATTGYQGDFTSVTLDDGVNKMDVALDSSGSCSFSGTKAYGTGVEIISTSGGTGTATPLNIQEWIIDQTKWNIDWLGQNPWTDSPEEAKKYSLHSQVATGELPMKLDMDNLPSINFQEINKVEGAFRAYMQMREAAGMGVTGLTYGLSNTLPDIFTTSGDVLLIGDVVYSQYKEGVIDETELNADQFQASSDTAVANSDVVRLLCAASRVTFRPYPETRVYAFELDVVGEAGPQPQICQFNITVEGATSTDRTKSKLLWSQTDFYRRDDVTLTDIISAGATAPTVEKTDRWDTCKFFGKQYFTNGIDGMWRYPDGSNEVEDVSGGSPKAFTIASFIGRLFAGCTTESAVYFPDRVRWCAVEDDQDWTGTGADYIDLNDTDGRVVKLLPLGGVLVAYKDTSLYNLHPTGIPDDAIVKQLVSPGIGAVAMGAVMSVVGRDGLPAHIFLGQGRGGYNVYMYTGNLLTPIGDDIKEELRDTINARQAKNAFAIVDHKRNQYMFFVCTENSTFPRRAWLYDIDTGQWKHWKIPETTCVGMLEAKEEISTLDQWTMFFGKTDSLASWPDPATYKDGALDVKMIAESGDWAVERRENNATLYRLHIWYEDWGRHQIEVSTSTDGGETYGTATKVTLGSESSIGNGQIELRKVDVMATAKRFRVKIESDYNHRLALTEVQMEIEEQGWIV